MTNIIIKSEYCINSFRYSDDFKQSKYFTAIEDNNTIQNIYQILVNLNADINLNDFILLSFYKTRNNLNLTHLEFFKQIILNKYYQCISSNELIKFNLINKPKHLHKRIVKNYRLNKDYLMVGQYIFYIVPEIFKNMLATSSKHKDIYLTYIHLEEYIYFYDQLQKYILNNKINEYKRMISTMHLERHRMETELQAYELADSIDDKYRIDSDNSDDSYKSDDSIDPKSYNILSRVEIDLNLNEIQF